MRGRTRAVRIIFLVVAIALLPLIVWQGRLLYLRTLIANELQPVALSNCTLTRVGSANDGGYLMCEGLPETIDAAYSYGVGHNDDWGCQISIAPRVNANPFRPFCSQKRFFVCR